MIRILLEKGSVQPIDLVLRYCLAAARAAVFATGHTGRLGHFRQITVFRQGGRLIDLFVGQFDVRIHERPLMKIYRTKSTFSMTISEF